MSNVKLVWATENGDDLIAYQARVSNPNNQNNTETAPKLIRWMLDNGHVSPFQMVNCCLEINCHRDIGRQILRHASFSFQEMSQRYCEVGVLDDLGLRECRLQDPKNRQNSIISEDKELNAIWLEKQQEVLRVTNESYQWALSNGLAKEVARVVLPEGLTPSRLYINGNMRSWIFYLKSRLADGVQKEHQDIAKQCYEILIQYFPITMDAFFCEE